MSHLKPLVEQQKLRLSLPQLGYLGLVQGVGSMLLNFGINFGLATAMYRNNPTPTTVWVIPGTLAGDAAVTLMVQVTLTWIIAGLLTRMDVQNKRVAPLCCSPPSRPWLLSFLLFQGNFDFVSAGQPSRFVRLLLSAFRGFIFAGAVGIVFWPLSLAYLIPVFGNHGTIPNWPAPEIFKGVFGAILGLFTTPVIAALALVEAGGCRAAQQTTVPVGSVVPTSAVELLADPQEHASPSKSFPLEEGHACRVSDL